MIMRRVIRDLFQIRAVFPDLVPDIVLDLDPALA